MTKNTIVNIYQLILGKLASLFSRKTQKTEQQKQQKQITPEEKAFKVLPIKTKAEFLNALNVDAETFTAASIFILREELIAKGWIENTENYTICFTQKGIDGIRDIAKQLTDTACCRIISELEKLGKVDEL